MEIIKIQGAVTESRIVFGDLIESLNDHSPIGRPIIITDDNVLKLHQHRFPEGETIVLEPGERSKTLTTISELYRRFLELGAGRSSFVMGIGGGVVCDITGFAASTFLRGLPFGFVPTTLLAQVDAAIGGKNGVNLNGYKNQVGTFSQPRLVWCDFQFLKTLPQRELRSGLAEIVKAAAIGDPELFTFLEKNGPRLATLDREVLERAVRDAVRVKADIVSRDETETGARRVLNFGHTLGHALERAAGLPHGEAVSVGMVLAGRLSTKRGLLGREDFSRLGSLLRRLGLPTYAAASPDRLMDAVYKDKKRTGTALHFVWLKGIGRAVVEEIECDDLAAELRAVMKEPQL